jgi:GNAT superfamily N-acetyltransferase
MIAFEPALASPEEWQAYHEFRRRRHQEESPEDPEVPDQVVERRMQRPDPYMTEHRWLARRDDRVVGELSITTLTPLSPEYESNKHLLYADGWVIKPNRRQGIGRGWVPKVVELMERHGARVLTVDTHDEAGHAFLRNLGGEARFSEAQSRLDLRAVDWDKVAGWVREGQSRSPGTRLELYVNRLPEERHEEFARVSTELLNTMPWEGLDHGDIVQTVDTLNEWYSRMDMFGSQHHVYVSRESDGTISGMTDVIKHPHEPGFVRQLFTGVHPRARGRGLGKWLKAAMLEHVRGVHPDTVYMTTENAGSNASMLAINHALGFRPYRTATTYQIGLRELAQLV